jgi:hypothetical protein
MKNSDNNAVLSNVKNGTIFTVYLKNGLRINGRFTVWKKYQDETKFLDSVDTGNHFWLYSFAKRDYTPIVKNNVVKIVSKKQTIIV